MRIGSPIANVKLSQSDVEGDHVFRCRQYLSTLAAIHLPVKLAGISNGIMFTEHSSGRRVQVRDGYMDLRFISPGIEIWTASL